MDVITAARLAIIGNVYGLFDLDNSKYENWYIDEGYHHTTINSTATRSTLRVKYDADTIDEYFIE